ncbi:MAG: helix-turn-helix domain-containing protein, partial [Anaerolineales bacterium]|nr:helix-turn-helix domain-containing protein [Anaerolineales bacterium]
MRQKAVQMYVDGANFRRIARHLGVNPQSVANWVKAHAEQLPAASLPETVEKAEMDELFTFIGDKKNKIYILTIVDRKTRCILSWSVVWKRTEEALQRMVDEAPKAKWYFSDAF